jgi:hypothetical protein
MGDALDAGAVERDEGRDAGRSLGVGEDVADAAQVPLALLADGRKKTDRLGRPDAAGVERARDGEERGEADRVVGDPRRVEARAAWGDAAVGAWREDRVDVGLMDDYAIGRRPSSPAEDVSFVVARDAGEADLAEVLEHAIAARRFVKRRRFDLAELDDLARQPFAVRLDEGARPLDRVVAKRGLDRRAAGRVIPEESELFAPLHRLVATLPSSAFW